jgi:predicted transcriptional regulator
MTTWDIHARLRNRGYTLTRIARELGVDRSAVSHNLLGDMKSARIEAAIAKAAGLTVEKFRRLRKAA